MYKWIEKKEVRPLNKLTEGQKGTIVKIRGKGVTHLYLKELGLKLGAEIMIEKKEVNHNTDAVFVRTDDREIRLEDRLAMNIRVEIVRAYSEKNIPNMEKESMRPWFPYSTKV